MNIGASVNHSTDRNGLKIKNNLPIWTIYILLEGHNATYDDVLILIP